MSRTINQTEMEDDGRRVVAQVVAHHLRAAFKALRLTETSDDHLARTPENVTNFLLEFFKPFLDQAEPPAISTFSAEEMTGQCVMIKNLSYHSMCAHHLTPFFGSAHVAYVPDALGIGIGAPAKLLEYYSRRPQLQERLAGQLADALIAACAPRGVMVLLTARQMCMEMRGERSDGVVEATAVRGCFSESHWRDMFLSRLPKGD